MEYGAEFTVRRVRQNGEIKWHGQLLYISAVLAKEPVGLKPINDDQWELRYSFHRLGILDMRTQKIVPAKHWHSDK